MESWLDDDFEFDEGDDDLSDYDPDEEVPPDESDSYDSEDSDADFLDNTVEAEVQTNADAALMSKDKTIQYSLDPPPNARPPPSRVGVIPNEGILFPNRFIKHKNLLFL